MTSITILRRPPPDAHDFHPNHLRALQNMAARSLLRDPQRRDAIRTRVKALKDEFDPEELREDRPPSRTKKR